MRREMTDAEAHLWYHLRRHGLGDYKFRRQHPLDSYILDFYCPAARLVIEIDGGQHFVEDQQKRDEERTQSLTEKGMRVLRFSNREVLLETNSVLDVILGALNPSP
jgi:very-short-patch-repair endonuclease